LSVPPCGSRGAFIWLSAYPDTKPAFAGLSYQWPHPDSHQLIETVLRASSEVVANVAFNSALTHYPSSYLTLQQRGRVIRDNRFRVVVGGKKA
jgi:hypothetical protein